MRQKWPRYLLIPDLRKPICDQLTGGDLVLFTSVAAVRELTSFAGAMLAELFGAVAPEDAHLHFSPDALAQMLGLWKPAFIHHPRSKELVRSIVDEIGFSLSDTHFDVPKPRTAFPVGHLTTGIAFAFPWHRDTWYAAPSQQINWWLPVFDVRPDNAMKFDLSRFSEAVPNNSAAFDYYDLNRARLTTASQTKVEVQARPEAPGHEAADPMIIIGRPGSVLLFSGNQLHATIPNTSGRSRYSIDFRTVDRRDVASGVGAPLVDVNCTGTAIRDFVNTASGEPFDEAYVRSLFGEPPADAMLVFDGSKN